MAAPINDYYTCVHCGGVFFNDVQVYNYMVNRVKQTKTKVPFETHIVCFQCGTRQKQLEASLNSQEE